MAIRLSKAEYERLSKRKLHPFVVAAATLTGKRWEVEFAQQLQEAGLTYEREWRMVADRRFRFDFAWPAQRVALEIDGAVHRIRNRFLSDREKGNLAVLNGWKVLHVGSQHVRDGSALVLLKQILYPRL